MDTGQLLAFEHIVRLGSFSRAAQQLDISQPTISARIRKLEKEVGGALLFRRGRSVTLTERGESFLPYVQRALTVLEEGKQAARLAETGQRGRITIGTIESLTGGFLAKAVTRFYRHHPEVEIFIRTEHTMKIVPMLEDNIIKMGLITWPFMGADLVPILSFREPLILVVAPHHKLASRDRVTLKEASQLASPMLQVRWGPLARPLLPQLRELTHEKVEVPIDTARQLVLNGIGAAFLTHTLIADELKNKRLIEVPISDFPQLYRKSALVRLRRSQLSTAEEEFVAVLRQEAKQNLI
jgi:DNA-binding transcriptional LysR family regulator